jgi:hypothetical protein
MENFKEITFEANWTKSQAEKNYIDLFDYEPSNKTMEKYIESILRERIIFDMIDSNLFEINNSNDGENFKLEFKCFIKEK